MRFRPLSVPLERVIPGSALQSEVRCRKFVGGHVQNSGVLSSYVVVLGDLSMS